MLRYIHTHTHIYIQLYEYDIFREETSLQYPDSFENGHEKFFLCAILILWIRK